MLVLLITVISTYLAYLATLGWVNQAVNETTISHELSILETIFGKRSRERYWDRSSSRLPCYILKYSTIVASMTDCTCRSKVPSDLGRWELGRLGT